MKVDLYEIERKEREAIAWGDNQIKHHVRPAPDVTLALIARIRELEAALGDAQGLAIFHDETEAAERWLALVGKGVTIP